MKGGAARHEATPVRFATHVARLNDKCSPSLDVAIETKAHSRSVEGRTRTGTLYALIGFWSNQTS